jgi:hypothetical protein
MRNLLLFSAVAAGITVSAQTRVDLQNQGKGVDFTAATSTRPIKTGTTLPATCSVGDFFFKTDATAGANIYACTASNIWSAQAGGGSSSGTVSASTTIQSDGVTVGSRATQNIISGTGVVNVISDNGQKINIQHLVDTAFVETRATHQAGNTVLCTTTGRSGIDYTCNLQPTLTAYTMGMILRWLPDTTAPGGALTLNIDELGKTPVKLSDGLTDPAPADLISGKLYSIWYDGSSFRIMTPERVPGSLSADRPACVAAVRGRIWLINGPSGTKDEFAVCAKDAGNSYSWRVLY